ncbi:MAG: RsmE family RNA methyltransferase [Alphaproteobacteria bacterium]|nr:RsmE family RNA methyltransferase [Alphaproteobacteria bacterium]
MIRLFTPHDIAERRPIPLTAAQTHYALHVMRLKAGDGLLVFNGRDGEWRADIAALTKKSGVIAPVRQTRPQADTPPCALCPALIKKDKMDWVLQKAAELGATAIFPLITERSAPAASLNPARAQAIVAEAAEQCERLDVPVVHPPRTLSDFLQAIPADMTPVILAERGETRGDLPADKTPAFLIGPEGGFTPKETAAVLRRPDAVAIHLDGAILRAETAGIAALACRRWGNLFRR